MSKKIEKPKFQVQVKAQVYFYAEVPGNTLEEALTAVLAMKNFNALWEAPGDIIDTEIEIEGVNKA
jgi:hypothetical protein